MAQSASVPTTESGSQELRPPKVIFDEQKRPSKADVDALHHESHERCYIANSVRTELVVQARAGTL